MTRNKTATSLHKSSLNSYRPQQHGITPGDNGIVDRAYAVAAMGVAGMCMANKRIPRSEKTNGSASARAELPLATSRLGVSFGRMGQRLLIFLDIDGVLLPFQASTDYQSTCGALFPDSTLASLSRILDAFSKHPTAKPELILSSTWRAQENLIAEILDSFDLYGRAHGGPLKYVQAFDDITDPE